MSGEAICPCCESRDLRNLGKLQDSRWFAGRRMPVPLPGGSLYHCLRCFLKFRFPVQDAVAYQALYDNTSTSSWTADIPRRDWDKIVGYVLAHLPQGGRILDFGCNNGALLRRFGPEFEKHGVEINRMAAAVAAKDASARVWHSLEALPDDARFDIIVAADVVEHVANPGSLIDHLATRVADGGALVITTGDADCALWEKFGANWWYCAFPEHISFVSRRWFAHQPSAADFTVSRCENFRYSTLPPVSYVVSLACAYFFGMAPKLFLSLRNGVRALLRREGGVSVPGVGVGADHLFIVLIPKARAR